MTKFNYPSSWNRLASRNDPSIYNAEHILWRVYQALCVMYLHEDSDEHDIECQSVCGAATQIFYLAQTFKILREHMCTTNCNPATGWHEL